MSKSFIFFLMTAALVNVSFAVEKEHEMCCNSCTSKYEASSNLKTSCLLGCRLYGMIFLAHDRSVARSEMAGLCAKSCQRGAASPAEADACAVGCARQERVFREHQVTGHSAKLAVAFGLAGPPEVDSPAPYHGRMFNRIPAGSPLPGQPGPQAAWLLRTVRISVRPLPAGPDGRPRYWVEISEQAIPVRLTYQQQHQLSGSRFHEHQRMSAMFASGHRLSQRARAGIRWAACGLLLLSLVGLLWLCCSVFPTAPRVRVIRLAGVMRKQPLPSIQSGDILGSGAEDKKPLMMPV